MQQLIHLLLLACAVLGEDAVPLPPPPDNLARSVVSSGPGHEVSERVLSGRKWASLSTFSSRLSASGTTTKTGLAGFSLVAAGAVSGAMLNDMDEADGGVDLSDDNWKEAAWEMTKAAIQLGADIASEMKGVSPLLSSGVGAVIAVADIFIPTDEPLTAEDGQKMINEALEKAKEQWMQEMRDETVGLIQDALAAASLQETKLEIQSFTKDLVSVDTMDSMEPDSALAYAMALEKGVSHLSRKLFLPCLESGWGSEECSERLGSGAVYMLDALANVHFAIFAEIFRTMKKKLRMLKDHLLNFAPATASQLHVARQVLVSNFKRVGCNNSDPSEQTLERFKVQNTPYVIMKHINWQHVESLPFYDLASANAAWWDPSYNDWTKALRLVDSWGNKIEHYGNQGDVVTEMDAHFNQKYKAGGVDGPFAPFVVMKHENWGVVTDEIFFDLADATARFEALVVVGTKATVLVDGRFTELRWFGSGNTGALLADFSAHFKAKFSPKEGDLLHNMYDFCVAARDQPGSEMAKECCPANEPTCQPTCSNVTALQFGLFQTMQQRFRRVQEQYRYLLKEGSRDKFLDLRLKHIKCVGSTCEDALDISETNFAPKPLADFRAVVQRQSEVWTRTMEALEKGSIMMDGLRVFNLEPATGTWVTETISVQQSAGFARLMSVATKGANTPCLFINGQYFSKPTCADHPTNPQVCSSQYFRWNDAQGRDNDPSPVFWDFKLSSSDVTIQKFPLLWPGEYGQFSSLVLRVQPTPHPWPLLAPPEKKSPYYQGTMGSAGCANIEERYLRCTGEDGANGRDKSVTVEFNNPLKWEVSFYMRLSGLGGTAAALQFGMRADTAPATLLLDGVLKKQWGFFGASTELMDSPVQEDAWHSYRIKRSAGSLWVIIDDVLVLHQPLQGAIFSSFRIRPWRSVGSMWGFTFPYDRHAGIYVLNNYHDATGGYGRYFSFNAEDIGLDINDGTVDISVRHCKRNTIGGGDWHPCYSYSSGDVINVRLFQSAGTKRGGNRHGRLEPNVDTLGHIFKPGDLLLLNTRYQCPSKRSQLQGDFLQLWDDCPFH